MVEGDIEDLDAAELIREWTPGAVSALVSGQTAECDAQGARVFAAMLAARATEAREPGLVLHDLGEALSSLAVAARQVVDTHLDAEIRADADGPLRQLDTAARELREGGGWW